MSMNIDGSFIIAIASIGFFSLPEPLGHSTGVSRVLIAGVPMEPEQHHGRYRGRQSSSSVRKQRKSFRREKFAQMKRRG